MFKGHLTHRGILWEKSDTDESGMCGHVMKIDGWGSKKFFGIAD